MVEKNPEDKTQKKGAEAAGAEASASAAKNDELEKAPPASKAKKEKPIADPSKRGYGGFDRSQFKGKNPIFRTMKKSGR